MSSFGSTTIALLIITAMLGASIGYQAESREAAQINSSLLYESEMNSEEVEKEGEAYGAFMPEYSYKEGIEGAGAVVLGILNGFSVFFYENSWLPYEFVMAGLTIFLVLFISKRILPVFAAIYILGYEGWVKYNESE
jgi:hypothetical protein